MTTWILIGFLYTFDGNGVPISQEFTSYDNCTKAAETVLEAHSNADNSNRNRGFYSWAECVQK